MEGKDFKVTELEKDVKGEKIDQKKIEEATDLSTIKNPRDGIDVSLL